MQLTPTLKTRLNPTALKFAATAALMNLAVAAATDNTSQAGATANSAIVGLESNLISPLCQVHAVLTGPLVVAAIVLAVVIGGILKLVGNRNAMSVIFGALTAGVLIFLSGTIVKLVLGDKREIACYVSTDLNSTKPNAAPTGKQGAK